MLRLSKPANLRGAAVSRWSMLPPGAAEYHQANATYHQISRLHGSSLDLYIYFHQFDGMASSSIAVAQFTLVFLDSLGKEARLWRFSKDTT